MSVVVLMWLGEISQDHTPRWRTTGNQWRPREEDSEDSVFSRDKSLDELSSPVWSRAHVCAYVCMCMWRTEDALACHSSSGVTFFLCVWDGVSSWPGAYVIRLGWLAGQQALRPCLFLLPRSCVQGLHCICGLCGLNAGPLMLVWEALYLISHLNISIMMTFSMQSTLLRCSMDTSEALSMSYYLCRLVQPFDVATKLETPSYLIML